MTSKKIAIYPGTFDPITLGHLDIIKRASALFDKLVIAVATNPSKKPLFLAKERVDMIKETVNDIKNIKIKSFNGLLVEFARKEQATIIIRGLRAVSDFEHEFQMSFVNRTLYSDIETIFLPATGNAHFISSSCAKEIARLDGNTESLVSKKVRSKLIEKLKNE